MRISDWSSDVCSSDLKVTPALFRQSLTKGLYHQFRRAFLPVGSRTWYISATPRHRQKIGRRSQAPAPDHFQLWRHRSAVPDTSEPIAQFNTIGARCPHAIGGEAKTGLGQFGPPRGIFSTETSRL